MYKVLLISNFLILFLHAGPLNKGTSAWIYDQNPTFIKQLQGFNSSIEKQLKGNDKRLNYLFPAAGGITFTDEGGYSIYYDSDSTDFYRKNLPLTDLYPMIDSGNGEAFSKFSPEKQILIANEVADKIVNDKYAKGVQVDIEPFSEKHLPFYKQLKARLHEKNKFMTMFTMETEGEIYKLADIVVLSGYDITPEGGKPSTYRERLSWMVRDAMGSCKKYGCKLMVGLPFASSTREFSYRDYCKAPKKDLKYGFGQELWVESGLGVIKSYWNDPTFLGVSIWGFYGPGNDNMFGQKCFFHPDLVSDGMLKKFSDYEMGNGENCQKK